MANILIIEDEVQLTEVYSFLLSHQGHAVVCANNGLEGLVKASAVVPDLILLDMMMPKLDGLGFLERYKTMKPAHVKIIILSNMQSREHEAKAFALGASRYHIKATLTPEQLLAVVDEVLGA